MEKDSRYAEEQIINVKELFWQILEQWKAVCAVSFCVMLVFLGCSYIHSTSKIKKEEQSKKEQEQLTNEAIIASLPVNDQSLVSSTYRLWEKSEDLSEYINSAPIMQLDPNHVKRLRASWTVDSFNDNSTKLIMSYVLKTQKEEFVKQLIESSGVELNNNQFNDLFFITFPDETNDDVICCDVFLTDSMNTDAIQERFGQLVEDTHSELQGVFGEHEIKDYQCEVTNVTDKRVYEKQEETLDDYANICSKINSLKNMFSADQKNAYQKMKEKTLDPGIEESRTAPSTITFVNIIFGFILGMFLYIGSFFLYVLVTKKVISSDALADLSIRSLGEWYAIPDGFTRKNIIQDVHLLRKHHRSHLDRENEIDSISYRVKSFCNYKKINELVVIAISDITEKEEAFIHDLSNAIIAKNIEVKYMSIGVEDSILDDAILNTQAVILVVIGFRTKYDDIGTIVAKCNDFERPVLGSVYLG